MAFLGNGLKNLKNKVILKLATGTDPDELIKLSQERAVRAFHRAYSQFPAYQDICAAQKVSAQTVNDIESFKRNVPLLDKLSLFYSSNSRSVLDGVDLRQASSVLLSSGTTGIFGFGLSSVKDQKDSAMMTEVMMDHYYHIGAQKTLVLNCLPQAVKMPGINVTVAEIGPRGDSLSFLLKTLASRFDQTIIIGDATFAKNALEEARDEGVDLKILKIHLIVGGAYLPESLRQYLIGLLHIRPEDPKTGTIYSSMGISEFGLNLFFESAETVRLRTFAYKDDQFRRLLLGSDTSYLPMFFNYLPQQIFVELVDKALVVTSLNENALLPLIRYKTGDEASVVGYQELKKILAEREPENFLPPFHSPLALIYGKKEALAWNNQNIYPLAIQDGLYKVDGLSPSITGNFRLCLEAGSPCIHIQLKKGKNYSEDLYRKAHTAASAAARTDLAVKLVSYEAFPTGMGLDYERKFRFI